MWEEEGDYSLIIDWPWPYNIVFLMLFIQKSVYDVEEDTFSPIPSDIRNEGNCSIYSVPWWRASRLSMTIGPVFGDIWFISTCLVLLVTDVTMVKNLTLTKLTTTYSGRRAWPTIRAIPRFDEKKFDVIWRYSFYTILLLLLTKAAWNWPSLPVFYLSQYSWRWLMTFILHIDVPVLTLFTRLYSRVIRYRYCWPYFDWLFGTLTYSS